MRNMNTKNPIIIAVLAILATCSGSVMFCSAEKHLPKGCTEPELYELSLKFWSDNDDQLPSPAMDRLRECDRKFAELYAEELDSLKVASRLERAFELSSVSGKGQRKFDPYTVAFGPVIKEHFKKEPVKCFSFGTKVANIKKLEAIFEKYIYRPCDVLNSMEAISRYVKLVGGPSFSDHELPFIHKLETAIIGCRKIREDPGKYHMLNAILTRFL